MPVRRAQRPDPLLVHPKADTTSTEESAQWPDAPTLSACAPVLTVAAGAQSAAPSARSAAPCAHWRATAPDNRVRARPNDSGRRPMCGNTISGRGARISARGPLRAAAGAAAPGRGQSCTGRHVILPGAPDDDSGFPKLACVEGEHEFRRRDLVHVPQVLLEERQHFPDVDPDWTSSVSIAGAAIDSPVRSNCPGKLATFWPPRSCPAWPCRWSESSGNSRQLRNACRPTP